MKVFKKTLLQKIVSVAVLFALVFQPISVVFGEGEDVVSDGQISTSNIQETVSENDTNVQAVSNESSEISVESKEVINADTSLNSIDAVPKEVLEEIKMSSSAVSQGTQENNPYDNSNFSRQNNTSLKADSITGALSYSYEISVPEGRGGLKPDLKIVYNSSDGSNVNMIGYGWSFNIPSIERLNKQGFGSMYDQDYFSSSLSGELASTTKNGVYVARVESGDFLKYFYDSSTKSWKIFDKKGNVYTLGSKNESRKTGPSGQVASWYLDEIRDSNGNFISYKYDLYTEDGRQMYPKEITYTNHEDVSGRKIDGIFKVSFLYDQSRKDKGATSYQVGFDTKNKQSLKSIEIYANNNLKKKYDFGYTVGVNGFRAILNSITEAGYDANGVFKTFPPTVFEYTKGFENPPIEPGLEPLISGGGFTYALGSFFYGPNRKGIVYADINGDGYTDSFLSSANPFDGGSFISEIYWNKYGDSPLIRSIRLPYLRFAYIHSGPSGSSPQDNGARSTDLNGDGFNDFVGVPVTLCRMDCSREPNPSTIYIFNPNYSESERDYYFATTTNLLVQRQSFLGNINGSGLIGILQGEGMAKFSATDINGDGLDDIKVGDARSEGYAITTGFSIPKWIQLPLHSLDYWYNDMGVRLIDINADGLIDQLRGWILPEIPGFDNGYATGDFNEVYINTGDGFVRDFNFKSPYFIRIQSSQKWHFSYQMTDYYDTNGDGLVEIPNGPTTKADLLKTIKYKEGGKTEIEYTTTAGGKKLNPKLPTIMWIVSKITNSDEFGFSKVETYKYENGLGFFNGSYDRKFAGFEKVTKEDDSSVTVSYFHQGNTNNAQNGEVGDSYSKIGLSYKTEIFDKNGNLFSRSQNVYDESPIENVNSSSGFSSSSPKFIYLSKQIDESFDGQVNKKVKAIEYDYDKTNGNLIKTIDYGEVESLSTNTSSSPIFNDIGNDKTVLQIDYASNSNIILPSTLQIHYEVSSRLKKTQNNDIVSETKYYFDDLPFGELSKGNETKSESLVALGNHVSNQKTYNEFGQVISSTDGNGNVTSYTYDTYNLYPILVKNSLNQTTSYEYDYGVGKPSKITDFNNQIYTKKYDGFGRVIEEKQPNSALWTSTSTFASLVTKNLYEYNDATNNVFIKKTEFINDSLSNDSYTYFDGFGREIQTRKQTENPDVFAVVDIIYDSSGQIKKQSLPYFSNGSGKTLPTNDEKLYTGFTYDALGRNVQKTNTLGTILTSYIPGQMKIVDQLGNEKTYTKDVFGRLVGVGERNNNEIYSTAYEYDFSNNLVKITDALGNVRNFSYDLLGRRIYAEDLHKFSDILFGFYRFKYDNNGNLIEKTDPNGTVVSYTFDSLNRLKKTEVTDSSISNIPNGLRNTYTYDNCDFGVGKLCSTTYFGESNGLLQEVGSTDYLYNLLGGVQKETKILNGKTFVTQYGYTDRGVIENTIDQSGKVSYRYNSANLIDSVNFVSATTTSQNVSIARFDYSPTGQPTAITYGNGSLTTNTYDSSKLYRLINKKTVTADNLQLQNLSYTYDAVGNILEITDNSETDTKDKTFYTYDNLYRLLTASSTSFKQDFEYNAIGNLIKKTEIVSASSTPVVISYEYRETGYANPHAPTNISSTTSSVLSYDKNGNLTSFGSVKYKYDFENRLIATEDGMATSTYAYDQSGARVKVLNGNGEFTLYPSKYFNQKYNKIGEPILSSSHIFAGETLLSTFENKTPKHTNSGTCVIPKTGDFTLSSSCTIEGSAVAPGSVIVPSGKVLTVNKESQLLIDLKKSKLLVKKGGGVLIKKGGAVRQVKEEDNSQLSIFNYHLTDHLGSVTLSTDASGKVSELTTYYPYGSINEAKGGSSKEQRKYIGQEYDNQTGLSYLNARYYDGSRGQFLNDDPEFWITSQSWLADPQNQNSYSYARNNPITLSDPSGRSVTTGLEGAASPFVYAYQHPIQTVGVMLVVGGAAIVAPVAVAVGGAVLGGYAIGTSLYNAYNAPDFDTRDYYIGQTFSLGLLTAGGIKGGGSLKSGGSVKEAKTFNLKPSDLSGSVKNNFERFVKKLPANSRDSIKITSESDGSFVFSATSPGKVPKSSAVYTKTVSSNGETVKLQKTTYDPNGQVVHTKDKYINSK